MQEPVEFDVILERACRRKGSLAAVETELPRPKSPAALRRITDDRWLAAMTRSVFRSGFVWKIVDAKWDGFEEAFRGFDTMACAMLSDEDLERLHADTRIIRNGPKIRTVRDNAVFVRLIKQDHGSFARWIADWDETDIVGLWKALKDGGSRLGGNIGPMSLRSMGKDTFILTRDVVRGLIDNGVVERQPTSQRALARTQAAFNGWRERSGRPLCQLSRILAMSVG